MQLNFMKNKQEKNKKQYKKLILDAQVYNYL